MSYTRLAAAFLVVAMALGIAGPAQAQEPVLTTSGFMTEDLKRTWIL